MAAGIPTIPGTGRVVDQQIGVKRSAQPEINALAAERGAFQAGAQAVTDVTGAIAQFEEHKQKAEEVAAFNQASIDTRKATSAFRDSLRKNPDDRQWVPNWEKTAQTTRDQILSDSRLTGAARTKMAQTLDSWQGQTTAEFATAADIAGSERRKRVGMLAADEALLDGNENAARAAVDGLVRTGDMWAEDAQKLKLGFGRKMDVDAVQRMIDDNPFAALDFIADKDNASRLSPGQRVRFEKEARERMHGRQADRANEIRADLDSAEGDGDATEAILAGLKNEEKTRTISAKGAANIRGYVNGKLTKASREAEGVARHDANELVFEVLRGNPATMPDPNKWSQEISDQALLLPTAFRIRVLRELKSKMDTAKAQGAKEMHPVEAETYRLIEHDFERGFTTGGEKDAKGEPLEDWKKRATPEMRRAAEDYYHQVLPQMKAWFDQKKANNEKIDYKEADEYRRHLTQPYLDGVVKQALFGLPAIDAPTTADKYETGKTYKDAKGNRAKYLGNGKWQDVK